MLDFKMDVAKSSSVQVQGTNDSSIVSKLSMSNLNYIEDQYLKYFVKKPQKRSALINRGYYLRSKAIEYVVQLFLSSELDSNVKQIISIGAGFDTRYFWAKDFFNRYQDKQKLKYVEIDFPGVMNRKVNLGSEFGLYQSTSINKNGHNVICKTDDYAAIGYDLRTIGPQLRDLLTEVEIDFTQPTLFISEVVLAYLTGSQSSRVLSWINHNFSNSFLCIFEQIFPHDGFGQVMRRHFEKLGSPLLSICDFPTIESHKSRHKKFGFHVSNAIDLHSFYTNLISLEERRRVEKLEMFDEFEEMSNVPVEQSHMVQADLKIGSVQAYGHCMALTSILQNKYVILAGGYGIPLMENSPTALPHSRLKKISLFNLSTNDFYICHNALDELSSPLHASLVSYQIDLNSTSIFMFGGRTSPVSSTNSLRMIEIFKRGENFNYTQRTVKPNSNVKPEPRWRHSSSIVDHQIIVVGGRNSLTVFNDIWSFDINSLIWSKFENESDHFKPRHSHSAVLWENNPTRSVIISGGLGKDMNPLNDVFMLQFCERSQLLSLRGLDIQPNLLPRYSHTSHIMGNILLLVGGVQFSHRSCDDIAVINLATKTWYKRISLPCSVDNSPIRLLGHVSCLTKKTSECVLTFFGGGSNCFSFGTSFNKSPFKVKLNLRC